MFSCKTTPTTPKDIAYDENKEFLSVNPNAEETFRVLINSDSYNCFQMKFTEELKRVEDPEGDNTISVKLKEYDKINEVCDGTLSVWIYPDTGKLMKIRPKKLAQIAEVNTLMVEDLKRWNFQFTNKMIELNNFDIKYRIILRKLQTDEKIMKEVMEKAKDEAKRKQKADD